MKFKSGLLNLNFVNYLKLKMTKLETTAKVERLRLSYKDEDLIKKIGISKPTLYARIANHKWKTSEIFLIEKLT